MGWKPNHNRMRPKAGAPPTALERRYMAYIASLPCLVCGRPATVHHVSSDGFKRIARSHMLLSPLCPGHHMIQHGPTISVEALGHAGFTEYHGIDLYAEAQRLRDGWDG